MESLLNIDIQELIKAAGYVGIFAIVFAESGLFIGFFLPGDTLLFTAGLLASQGFFSISLLTVGIVIAAIIGDQVGYIFGRHIGPKIFTREDSFWFHKKHIARAEAFYEKHGRKTIIIARFIPVIRTFAPIVAGVAHMNYKTFLAYNIIGGVAWGVGVTLLGYFLGSIIPGIDAYLLPILSLIVFLSVLPGIIAHLRAR